MTNRRAHTLIELCVTMTVGSALMVTTVGLLHQSLSLASTARGRADAQRTVDRLANDFRHDVHLASAVTNSDAEQIEFTRDDEAVVRYRADEQRIERTELSGDAIVRRASYSFDQAITIRFETVDAPRRVAIVLEPAAASEGPRRTPAHRITAVVGRRLALQLGELSP
jgi:hypothetical protein